MKIPSISYAVLVAILAGCSGTRDDSTVTQAGPAQTRTIEKEELSAFAGVSIEAAPVEVPQARYAGANRFWQIAVTNESDAPAYMSWDVPDKHDFWYLSVSPVSPDHFWRDAFSGLQNELMRYSLRHFPPPNKAAPRVFFEATFPAHTRTVWKMAPPKYEAFLVGSAPLYSSLGFKPGSPAKEGTLSIPATHTLLKPRMMMALGQTEPPSGYWLFITTKESGLSGASWGCGIFRTAAIYGPPVGGAGITISLNEKPVLELSADRGGGGCMIPVAPGKNQLTISGSRSEALYVWVIQEGPYVPHRGYRNEVLLETSIPNSGSTGQFREQLTFETKSPADQLLK